MTKPTNSAAPRLSERCSPARALAFASARLHQRSPARALACTGARLHQRSPAPALAARRGVARRPRGPLPASVARESVTPLAVGSLARWPRLAARPAARLGREGVGHGPLWLLTCVVPSRRHPATRATARDPVTIHLDLYWSRHIVSMRSTISWAGMSAEVQAGAVRFGEPSFPARQAQAVPAQAP